VFSLALALEHYCLFFRLLSFIDLTDVHSASRAELGTLDVKQSLCRCQFFREFFLHSWSKLWSAKKNKSVKCELRILIVPLF